MKEITLTKDEEIIKRRFKAHPEIINPSDELLCTLKKLQELNIATTDYPLHQMPITEALYDAQKFLLYYFRLNKVPYLYTAKVLGINFQLVRNINPLKIPVNIVTNSDPLIGSVPEILSSNPRYHIVFREINLAHPTTEHTSCSYIHEITHTQLDRLKGSIREYYNSEVLSLFNEFFHAAVLDKSEKVLRFDDARRIHEMSIIAQELRDYHDGKLEETRDELLEDGKYLVSLLKAYNLFIKFYYGTEEVQTKILEGIQAVFDGYMTLEEFLLREEVTYENSQDEKKLSKYFSRS